MKTSMNQALAGLKFVIERREHIGSMSTRSPRQAARRRAGSRDNFRYAAGVELAIVQEYLAAAYSLKSEQDLSGKLRDNMRAAHAEIMRIAIGEIRHLRAVNDVLGSLIGRPAYRPALGVATKMPGIKIGACTRCSLDRSRGKR